MSKYRLKFFKDIIHSFTENQIKKYVVLQNKFSKYNCISIDKNIKKIMDSYNISNINDKKYCDAIKIASEIISKLIILYSANEINVPNILISYEFTIIFTQQELNILNFKDIDIKNKDDYMMVFNLIFDICDLLQLNDINKKVVIYLICSLRQKIIDEKMINEYLLSLK